MKTNIIGLLLGNVLSQFYSIIAKSVESNATNHGYRVILCNTDDNPEKELEYLRVLKSSRVEGIIITPTGKNSTYIDDIIKSGIKVVLLDRLVEGIICDTVLVDNYRGSYNATKYLIDQGYENIAIITGLTDRITGKKRLDGYISAIREAGRSEEKSMIKIGDFTKESGLVLANELLESKNRPDAIFATNMETTLGTLVALKNAGIKVPSEMGVIGFDETDYNAITDPPLTVVYRDIYNMGTIATDILLKKLNNKVSYNEKYPLLITVDTKLIIRDSTRLISNKIR